MTEISGPSQTIEPDLEPVNHSAAAGNLADLGGNPDVLGVSNTNRHQLRAPGRGYRPDDTRGQLNASFVFLLALTDTALLLSLIVWLLRRRGERPWAVFFGDRPATR